IFPATAYVEMAARGYAAVKGEDWHSVELRDVTFERPLVLAYGKPKRVNLTLENIAAKETGEATFLLSAADGSANGSEEKYCRGRVALSEDAVEQVSRDVELGQTETRLPIG